MKLLEIMEEEAELQPYFYKLGTLDTRSNGDISTRDELIHWLRHFGDRTGRTHLDSQAIKTEASLKHSSIIYSAMLLLKLSLNFISRL
ncbi:hypothetical protein [Baaleninema simplex]|uniref:hypothetical protein n=1 Tax=Baaleninema simplex TaxID=2862350 RepID=UPI000347796B|nr:hypothetical protein [Baaleninema simplex]